jgi:phytoene synthase
VIGEMMLPILEPHDLIAATAPARDLGNAFQLTNFLRDIGDDLARGRQYIPQLDLRRFDVDLTRRRVTTGFVELMRFEIDRCRTLYRSAQPGIEMLPASSARCITAAHVLYSGILDEIEASGFDVFTARARVPTHRKLAVAARAALGR